jgi:hypothetical protein
LHDFENGYINCETALTNWIVVLAHSKRRVQTIRNAVAAITPKIFWFASLEQIRASFFSAIWLRPVGDQPQTFFENHP